VKSEELSHLSSVRLACRLRPVVESRKVPFLLAHTEPTTLVRAVLLYRSKFSDCSASAVPNSHPNFDLLWDNVIAGHGEWRYAGAINGVYEHE
jgi:hypothetical protein